MPALAHIAVTEAIRRAIPDGAGSVSAWAEAKRYVDRGARKGKWSNMTAPYLIEIMDAFTNPFIREVVVQKPAQWGGSEALANVCGYFIEVEPTEIAYVAEKQDKATAWTVESFDAMVAATPSLADIVKTSSEDNNQRYKAFPGGHLFILWATSPAELSSRPYQVILFDEKAAYKPTNEGDPVKLGEARTKTYDGYEKIGKISSPRNAEDDSDIEADFLRGDKRQFWVPCPSCDDIQLLEWKNVHWDGDSDPDLAYMVCVHCGVQLEYEDLQDMLERAHLTPGMGWIKDADLEKPFWPEHPASPEVASFKANQLYSPFVRWSRMVKDFLEAKKKGPGSLQMQTWVNTSLGEPWRPYERIDYADIGLNREDYPAPVPAGVLALTAGVDVQADRLEYEICGWGFGDESWSIEIGILDGDPGQLDVWEELTEKLTQTFEGELGTFRVQRALIDSGYHAKMVYKYVKRHVNRKWYACKGMSEVGKPIISKATWVGEAPKVRMIPVGTGAAKDEIFSNLKVLEPGPGYCHFPARPEYDDAYLKQLCAEKKVKRFRRGQEVQVYEKLTASIRNEALDLRVYNIAARQKLNPNYEAIAKNRLLHAEVVDRPEVDDIESDTPTPPDPPPGNVVKFGRVKTKNNEFGGYRP